MGVLEGLLEKLSGMEDSFLEPHGEVVSESLDEYILRYEDVDIEKLEVKISAVKGAVREKYTVELSPKFFAPGGFGIPGCPPDLTEKQEEGEQKLYDKIVENGYDVAVDDWFYIESFDSQDFEDPEGSARDRAGQIVNQLEDEYEVDGVLEGNRIFTE